MPRCIVVCRVGHLWPPHMLEWQGVCASQDADAWEDKGRACAGLLAPVPEAILLLRVTFDGIQAGSPLMAFQARDVLVRLDLLAVAKSAGGNSKRPRRAEAAEREGGEEDSRRACALRGRGLLAHVLAVLSGVSRGQWQGCRFSAGSTPCVSRLAWA